MSIYKVTIAAPSKVLYAVMRAPYARHRANNDTVNNTYSYEVEAPSSSAATDQLLDALEAANVSPDGIACSARLVTP